MTPSTQDNMSQDQPRAERPEDITRLLVERMAAADAEGMAALYEADAVIAYPPGQTTVGHQAIRAFYQAMIDKGLQFAPEPPLPSLVLGELALTATVAKDLDGARAQVARRQGDGRWLRILDRPTVRG